ncbi:DUF6444 domain-containing protein [Ectobacillus antri]|nr:DUF6444 domain-containing protein [Ectobacillus antri]MDG4657952.1 DUF6444 domain-containing protein [Ectobacillus antri]
MMTRDEILTACHAKPDKIVQLIQTLFQRNQELEAQVQSLLQRNHELEEKVQTLEARIQTLEAQGKKNSTNSHLPPSSDWAPIPKSSRMKTGRQSGGQPGHTGHTLRMTDHPDHRCVDCQHKTRQLF